MIELTKLAEPDWFLLNAETKTDEYKSAPPGKKPSPWRVAEIVDALKLETSRKCMYCECAIDDGAYSAVEHIRPKKDFEHLVLTWENLGLACTRCNTNKGEYWSDDEHLRILNPYVDKVSDHLEFRGPLTVAALGSSRGRNTVRKLKFRTREDLLISRMQHIESLDDKMRLWHDEHDLERRALFAEDVREACSKEREFSAVLIAYARQGGFPI